MDAGVSVRAPEEILTDAPLAVQVHRHRTVSCEDDVQRDILAGLVGVITLWAAFNHEVGSERPKSGVITYTLRPRGRRHRSQMALMNSTRHQPRVRPAGHDISKLMIDQWPF